MSTRTEVTEDQIQAGFKALLDNERDRVSLSMVRAILTGALNPPLVLCRNCGKPKNEHKPICDSRFTDGDKYGCAAICPGYVWEASE